MTERDNKNKKPISRKQLALIGSLVLSIISVLIVQFRGLSTLDSLANLSIDRVGNERRLPRPKPSSEINNETIPTSAWPSISLAQAADFDPFAMPPRIAEKARNRLLANAEDEGTETSQVATDTAETSVADAYDEAQRQRIREIYQHGVSAIISRGEDRIALVGNREIRVGDLLEGFKVLSINERGVELELPPIGIHSEKGAANSNGRGGGVQPSGTGT